MGRHKGSKNRTPRAKVILEQLGNKEQLVRSHDRMVLKAILEDDKSKPDWKERTLIGELRKTAEMETRHIVCEVMQVTRIYDKGIKHCVVYSANICRCTHCSAQFNIPDLNCPCCGWKLRRNCHWKSEGANKLANKIRMEHEI